ncbi:GNAT family N-acetyltransferase [Bacillus sp. V59.32b]|uniref:GNAT family N-acetyltransferase n=1 Tax=Bacillus sp. V59.32b TaxID=1758642 RepID=UPI000E3CD8F3|nr:GNAT family N-acetyltransferase [Bacillus sp. V59.32b]RFU67036.1 N-acetyltransferase [Bacillus sp. V59.32b]
MTILSERLYFQPYEEKDFEFLFSLLSDPKMVQYIGNGQTRNGAKKFLDWIYCTYEAGPDLGLMVLVRKEDNTPIGHAGLVPQVIDREEEIEIGYWIAQDYWGKGYATEAAKALRDHGINQLGKKRLIALIQPGNLASREVAKKIGMNCEKEIVLSGQHVCVYSNS